jgi:hypothetical protein
VDGRVHSLYIGKNWNRETLARFHEKVIQVEQNLR